MLYFLPPNPNIHTYIHTCIHSLHTLDTKTPHNSIRAIPTKPKITHSSLLTTLICRRYFRFRPDNNPHTKRSTSPALPSEEQEKLHLQQLQQDPEKNPRILTHLLHAHAHAHTHLLRHPPTRLDHIPEASPRPSSDARLGVAAPRRAVVRRVKKCGGVVPGLLVKGGKDAGADVGEGSGNGNVGVSGNGDRDGDGGTGNANANANANAEMGV